MKTRISHSISRQVRQDVAPDLFSMTREHCSCNKASVIEDKDGVADCLNCQKGCEKCGLIIGFDPGTRVTGYGVIEVKGSKFTLIDFGCIRPPQSLPLPDRYLIIFESVESLIKNYCPDAVVVETQFVQKNAQSALKLGMARGSVIIATRHLGVEIFEYSPSTAKKAVTGRGQASKSQVQQMIKHLLGLKEIPTPEDAADALSLAICHAQRYTFSGVK